MAKNMYLNVPVQDLPKSKAFFTALGFGFNEHYTDETAACLVLGETIFVMLLTYDKFQQFTKKSIADATQTTEMLIGIDVPSRDAVDAMIDAAVAAGGSLYRNTDDYGWMYSRSFADLDGHQWEVLYIDETQSPQ